jgi:hypothetical protein
MTKPTGRASPSAALSRPRAPAPSPAAAPAPGGNVTKTIRPDQPGALKQRRLHGSRLVCVRYRIDAEQQRRYTTVELIVDEAPWPPPKAHAGRWVYVRLRPDEHRLCNLIQSLGGTFAKTHQAWQLTPTLAKQLRLTDRLLRTSS